MNNIKEVFSIKDLENFSGIKAHTIRIWEKRYNLLSPRRTDTGIRIYSLDSLKKLLNITLLYKNGYKISKIADLHEEEIPVLVRELTSRKLFNKHIINSFKLAAIKYDYNLFNNTYNKLLAHKSFREIFLEYFIPLLNEIGLLWQTNTITPAQEHFISNIIKQKIFQNIENIHLQENQNLDNTYVLFLPIHEIHEIGLLFIHYELLLRGYHSIYLGQSVPLSNLKNILNLYHQITFVSYFTVYPEKNNLLNYLNKIATTILRENNDKLFVLGKQINETKIQIKNSNIKQFTSINKLLNAI